MAKQPSRSSARRYWTLAVVGLLAVSLLAFSSVVFSNSEGAVEVAEDASVQVRAQALLGGITVSRAMLSEALLFGVAYKNGELSETALRAVLAEAESALADVASRHSDLETVLSDPDIHHGVKSYAEAGAKLVAHLGAGRFEEAQGVDSELVGETFDSATQLLVEERDERERHIAAVRAGVGDVANAARFVVAFFIPGLAILAVLAFVRHRQRRIQLEAELGTEEELRGAKDQFLSAVAHELRTPLTAVVGFAETLRDPSRELNQKDRDELVHILADQASDTAFMIEDLLVFARANIGDLTIRPQVLDTDDLIARVAPGSSGKLDGGRLSVIGAEAIWADPLRMRQVLRNLLSNALDHGGPRVEIRVTKKGSNAILEVADNGPGIPPELRAKVFEPYQHGRRYPGQTAPIGLGLTVAKSLVRLMEGDLNYRYEGGESVFEVTIPAATAEQKLSSGRGDRRADRPGTSPAQIIAAIQQESLEIVYQPIVDLRSSGESRVVGFEALARFPTGSPPEWFAAAWGAGIGTELELEAIRAAVAGFRKAPQRAFLALNLSMETLMSPQLIDALDGVAPERIVLELSEDTVIDNYQRAKVYLDRLTRRGYRLAFDDLAPGRIDLWYLVRLRPSIVKIDISLVHDIDVEPTQRSLVNGLKWLSDVLKSEIVAEGIEREEELEILTRIGVPFGQGYLLGRPAPLEESVHGEAIAVLVSAPTAPAT